jgi:hypothetical protein
MLARAIILVVTSALLAACVNSERFRSNLGGPILAAKAEHAASNQTLASKVLGAIALERVTGRKPDPARVNALH